jgi:hypothetical protein
MSGVVFCYECGNIQLSFHGYVNSIYSHTLSIMTASLPVLYMQHVKKLLVFQSCRLERPMMQHMYRILL